MDATLILIDSDAELLRARALVDQLWNSTIQPVSLAGGTSAPDCRLRGNEVAAPAAERCRFDPPPDVSARPLESGPLPLLGTPSRVSEVMRGKKGLSMAMLQRLRARFRVPADCPRLRRRSPPGRSTKRAAA